jgi:hypothetical protein
MKSSTSIVKNIVENLSRVTDLILMMKRTIYVGSINNKDRYEIKIDSSIWYVDFGMKDNSVLVKNSKEEVIQIDSLNTKTYKFAKDIDISLDFTNVFIIPLTLLFALLNYFGYIKANNNLVDNLKYPTMVLAYTIGVLGVLRLLVQCLMGKYTLKHLWLPVIVLFTLLYLLIFR